jgi:hypothetical protein
MRHRNKSRRKKAATVVFTELSSEQRNSIVAGVQKLQRFVSEILEHAIRWELSRGGLRISFSADKRAFAEMLNAPEPLLKVSNVVREVLGRSVQISVVVEPPAVVASTAGKDKGGK